MAGRRLTQAVHVKTRRAAPESAANGHAIAGPDVIVTRRAKDVVAFPPAIENIRSDLEWERCGEFAVHPPRKKVLVFIQKSASDNANRQRPGRPVIGKEPALLQGFVSRLIRHLLAAGGEEEQEEEKQQQERNGNYLDGSV